MKKSLVCVVLLCLSSFAFAGTISIDFEQYSAYTQITNQYAGVTFNNAMQVVVPYFDYFDYPPHSGTGAIVNDDGSGFGGDLMTISFASSSVSNVNFWYADPNPDGIVLNVYSTGGILLGTFTGPGTGSYPSSSDADVNISSGSSIGWITIDDADQFVDGVLVDDLAITTPEPGSLLLLGSGLLMGIGTLRRKTGV